MSKGEYFIYLSYSRGRLELPLIDGKTGEIIKVSGQSQDLNDIVNNSAGEFAKTVN